MMDYELPQRLQNYINTELENEAFCRQLAEMAPNLNDQQALLKIAESEHHHAQMFETIYEEMVGVDYKPIEAQVKLSGPYQCVLRQFLLSQNKTFQEYHHQFMKSDNPTLKEACYTAGTHTSQNINILLHLIIE